MALRGARAGGGGCLGGAAAGGAEAGDAGRVALQTLDEVLDLREREREGGREGGREREKGEGGREGSEGARGWERKRLVRRRRTRTRGETAACAGA